MSLEGMLDHKVSVYRLTETLNALREKVNSYTLRNSTERLAIAPPGEQRTDMGAGDIATGTIDAFMRAGADVIAEDVLDLTKGPHAPAQFRVLTVNPPRGHHTEITMERFHGRLS